MRRFLPFLAALFLSACVSAPPLSAGLPGRAEVEAFALAARFALTHGGERHSGRLAWRHTAAGDELRIQSPFGQVLAELTVDERLARLRLADGEVREATNAGVLLAQVLGYPLPIADLVAWVLARPERATEVEHDVFGRPNLIVADGWRIAYEYEDEAVAALPSRLAASRDGGPELRMRIEEWRIP